MKRMPIRCIVCIDSISLIIVSGRLFIEQIMRSVTFRTNSNDRTPQVVYDYDSIFVRQPPKLFDSRIKQIIDRKLSPIFVIVSRFKLERLPRNQKYDSTFGFKSFYQTDFD